MSEWTKRGECNHCGHCCQFVGTSTINFPVDESKPIDLAYVTVRGFQVKEGLTGKPSIVGDVLLFSPCPKHDTEAKQCKSYDNRPATCQNFPEHPDQIVTTACSHWFERMNEAGVVERVGGSGSPYPVQGV